MKESRFAILVGMSKYEENPLEYSVKDATDIKDVLIKHCRFEEENIKMVTNSNTSVIDQIDEAYKSIAVKFKRGQDLLLFYFSGHGEYDEDGEKSYVILEDNTNLFIGDILLNYFQPLKAKNQYIIIDACHSGKNFHIKPKHSKRKRERKLLTDSKEIFFLFAAEENKKAFQDEKLKNSYYTYYLIEAIKNKNLYDDDGWLTMTAIDEYVRKKLSTHKNVIQIPGSESRATGYKPFAFLNDDKGADASPIITSKPEQMDSNTNEFDLEQSLTAENRQFIQDQLKVILKNAIVDYNLNEFESDYEIVKNEGNYLPEELEKSLEERIILRAEQEGLEAIHDTFQRRVVRQKRNRTGLSGMLDMLYGEPEPEVRYSINYRENDVRSSYILFRAKKFNNVSGGLFVLFYQSKYGFVFCRAYFKYEWDGTAEKVSNFKKVELIPYLLKESNLDEIKNELTKSFSELSKLIHGWNEERKNEISTFLSRVKK